MKRKGWAAVRMSSLEETAEFKGINAGGVPPENKKMRPGHTIPSVLQPGWFSSLWCPVWLERATLLWGPVTHLKLLTFQCPGKAQVHLTGTKAWFLCCG